MGQVPEVTIEYLTSEASMKIPTHAQRAEGGANRWRRTKEFEKQLKNLRRRSEPLERD